MKKTKEELLCYLPVVSVLAMACCILWGSAFPGIKLGYQFFAIPSDEVASQILFAGIRFTLAGVLTILIGSVLNREVLRPRKESLSKIVVLCLFQTVLQYLFFYVGLANTSGVKGSIINGSNVFVAIIFACFVFRQEKITVQKMIGCLLGFAGVVLINLNGSGISLSFSLLGEGFILLSTVAYSVSSVIMKNYSKKENPVMLSGYQFLAGGLIMMACGFAFGGRLHEISGKGIGILVYLAFVSAAAYSVWGILLKYNPVSRVAVFGFMNPVSGVLLSALFLKEKSQEFGVKGVIALILVCIGIYVVNYSPNSAQEKSMLSQDSVSDASES
ncbi:MAG: DMT family transporter [Lachnospiraceae bacterium]|nr:DMT family transporter [Lachnospiraceae bacterium]